MSKLSPREVEVMVLMSYGHTRKAIAYQLAIAPKTVESHIRSIVQKLGFVGHSYGACVTRYVIEHRLEEDQYDRDTAHPEATKLP